MIDYNKTTKIIPFSKKLTVLYVEDNLIARKSTTAMLKEFFDNIIVAVDGEDGFDKYAKNSVDLIITDINMPKLNGIEMIAKIREKDKNTPILILTAFDESRYLMETIKLGIDGYLLKPILFEQFIEILIKTLEIIKLKQENLEYKVSLEKKVM